MIYISSSGGPLSRAECRVRGEIGNNGNLDDIAGQEPGDPHLISAANEVHLRIVCIAELA